MGSQVRWRTVPADLLPFHRFAEARGWLLMPSRTESPSPDPLIDWSSCRRGVLVRREERSCVIWKSASNGLWWADSLHSPVVEYEVGHSPDGVPHGRRGGAQGRMWFASTYLRAGHLAPADPDFVKAARALLNWPRRHWKIVSGDYESPMAYAYLESLA